MVCLFLLPRIIYYSEIKFCIFLVDNNQSSSLPPSKSHESTPSSFLLPPLPWTTQYPPSDLSKHFSCPEDVLVKRVCAEFAQRADALVDHLSSLPGDLLPSFTSLFNSVEAPSSLSHSTPSPIVADFLTISQYVHRMSALFPGSQLRALFGWGADRGGKEYGGKKGKTSQDIRKVLSVHFVWSASLLGCLRADKVFSTFVAQSLEEVAFQFLTTPYVQRWVWGLGLGSVWWKDHIKFLNYIFSDFSL